MEFLGNVFRFILLNYVEIKTGLLLAIPLTFIIALLLPEKCNGYSYSIFLLVFICNLCFCWYIQGVEDTLTQKAKQEYYNARIEALK